MTTVLTHIACRSPEALYGCLSTIKTLRTGFPNCRFLVFNSDSHPAAWDEITHHTPSAGGELHYFPYTGPDNSLWLGTILLTANLQGTVVIADPDLMFWESCEGWDFGSAALAGNFIPQFKDPAQGYITHARIHPSLWYIPNIQRFRDAVRVVSRIHYEWDAFKPSMYKRGNKWYRWDTGAMLYEPLKKQIFPFTEHELKSYDHLNCGTQPHFAAQIPELAKMHEEFKTDPWTLKGAWDKQKEFSRAHKA